MNTEANKKAAVDFLTMIIGGKIDEAFAKYVDMSGKHHNIFTPAGMAALREGMKGAEEKFPNKQFVVKHVVAEGDLVAVHSHLILEADTMDFAAVHLLRFSGNKDNKIVEFWDIAHETKGSVNKDGPF